MPNLLILLCAFLLGSLPTAYLFGLLFKKTDIRKAGSGNVGGMNIYRVAGLLPGLLTVLIDAGKGYLAVYIATVFSSELSVILLSGILVVLCHNYNPWLSYKGGKGLATTFGVFLFIYPLGIVYAIICAVLLTVVLRDVNTAFGSASLLLPVILLIEFREAAWVLFGLALAVIIATRHINDFKAYRQGRRQTR
jgi:acyl phosphate:glycerol-3-phosphate acyltransferase